MTDPNVKEPSVMLFDRYFTGNGELDKIEYEKRKAKVTEPDGSVVFEMDDVEVPVDWSQLATDILARKYLRKAGVPTFKDSPDPKTGGETSIKQVVHRIVRTITDEGITRGYFSEMEGKIFQDELSYMLLTQRGAFNSPVWFNCGLYHQYGIEGKLGNWASDEEGNPIWVPGGYERPQCSACFIISVKDSLESIFDTVKTEAMIFKYGSGTGTNFSTLRSKYETLSGGGNSSGVMSFLNVFDSGAGATKSGGTTRRAAKMVCLDVDHPEIMDFIEWKRKEEKKAKALIAAGYEANFNGEAYSTVSGQNSNNSVRVNDHFMKMVQEDGDWNTVYRKLHSSVLAGKVPMVHKTYKAKEILYAIAEAVWECADPGIQFDTAINDWHTCSNTDRIYASNPCSEFMFLDDTACNLASLNLTSFSNGPREFDHVGFKHAVQIFSAAQEIIVDLAGYPEEKVARNSHDFRPLGLGYANLGTLLMAWGIPYDSDEGRWVASAITSMMCGEAYHTSARIASKIGPFPRYEENKEPMLRIIEKHKQCDSDLVGAGGAMVMSKSMWAESAKSWENALALGKVHGFRNSQMTVLAPTGTIGLLMDCDTTGVEPDYSLIKYKKFAGRGEVKMVNSFVSTALFNLGYDNGAIADIFEYIHEHDTVEGSKIKPEHLAVFDCANPGGKLGKRFISPMAHIKMLEATQPFISGSISKTINVPQQTTVEEIEDLYLEAWRRKLKCISIYRDGSKGSQPLTSSTDEAEIGADGVWGNRNRLAKERKGITLEARIGGHKLFLRTGEYEDGRLGEIFVDMYKEGAAWRGMMNSFARAVSVGLSYGVPLEKYVKMFVFSKFEPAGLTDHPNIRNSTSIVDFIFRFLGMKYLGDDSMVQVPPKQLDIRSNGDHDTEVKEDGNGHLAEMMGDAPVCDQCGNMTVRNGSCYRCMSCGNSMGCS